MISSSRCPHLILAVAVALSAVTAALAGDGLSFPSEDLSAKKVAYARAESTILSTRAAKTTSTKRVKPTVVVAKDGSGRFKTIQAAVNSLKQNKLKPRSFLIYIKKGLYFENVTIPKTLTKLTVVGDAGLTKVSFNQRSGSLNALGDPIGTGNSGTFTSLADDFTMINMVIENSSERPPPAVNGYQAVAFRASGNRTIVYNSSFYSYQDTLYAHKGVQYYKNCFVYGEIDFVFGYAKAFFDSCSFYMDSRGYAAVAAQFRNAPNEDNCFVFVNALVTGKNKGWLGRSWGRYACTIFAYSIMTSAVSPDGWSDFLVPARQFNSFFAEYRNRGIGANQDGRVWWQKVLSPAQISYYLTTNYIGLRSWLRPLPTAATIDA